MPGDEKNVTDKKKPHRERKAGRKAEKKKAKKEHVQELTDRQRNPKAFALNNPAAAERRFRRKQDLETKKQHIPHVNRTPLLPPPMVVAVVGPPKVGKTTLIQNLVKHYTRQPLKTVKGPATVVCGRKNRITLIECNNDINAMIDVAKVADLALLLIDASFGFEMEIFEFLNICQVHGMPRILGVLTHLDLFKNNKKLKRTKKMLKHRFWTEVYPGAKLFYLSGFVYEEYMRNDIKNLARFISVTKLRPLVWKTTHPYLLVDRFEDLTSPEDLRRNFKCDRNISLYGYVRGVAMNQDNSIHIPGCGDTKIHKISYLDDPCPLPEKKNRALLEKERLIYAPFSGVGGVLFDKDVVYLELGGSHSFTEINYEGSELVQSLIVTQDGIDVKRDKSSLKIFADSKPITSSEFKDNATFTDAKIFEFNDEKNDDEKIKAGNKSVIEELNRLKNVDEGDEAEDEDEEDEEDKKSRNYFEEIVEQDGRTRRKVVFNGDADYSTTEKESDSSDDEEKIENVEFRGMKKDLEIKSKITDVLNKLEIRESNVKNDSSSEESGIEMEIDEKDHPKRRHLDSSDDEETFKKFKANEPETKEENEISHEDEDDEDEDSNDGDEDDVPDDEKDYFNDFENSAVKWKENLAQKASDAFMERQNNTQNLYKLVYGNYKRSQDAQDSDESEKEGEEIGGIFRVMSEKQRRKMHEKDTLDDYETSVFPVGVVRDWTSENAKRLIKDCFVTGTWKKTEDAKELLKLDDLSDEEFGDFEDLETGEKHAEKKPEDREKETENKKELLEKKRMLKEKFDTEYDDKEEYSYYNDLKAQVDQQSKLNKSEFEGLPDDFRVELEGYRPGMYVRIELTNVPCELIENFDPTFPLIVGGLLPIEENIGYLQVRLKKHRWYGKVLKTKDPLIVSLGWRRFQTLPVFSKFEDNMRNRMLKYTPNHVSCMAHMYGPITPQGTGFLAIQDVTLRTPGYRIACTGSVVEVDKSTTISKKLKLIGAPLKIFKKTAFIQDMFHSVLEVGKFEGAKIRTVSGIRGQIKKALSKPEGAFRATFEDKIKMSDIVFCRTWYNVDVPKFYNPVTNLMLPFKEKDTWTGMKTLGQLKREQNIKNEAQLDSLYTPIMRKERRFKALSIPKKLQKALPYKSKQKNQPGHRNDLERKRIAVVKEPEEERADNFMKMLRTNYTYKQMVKKNTKKEKANARKQVNEKEELKKMRRQKEVKKKVFRVLGLLEKKKNKRK